MWFSCGRHGKLLWCARIRSSSRNSCVFCCFLFQVQSAQWEMVHFLLQATVSLKSFWSFQPPMYRKTDSCASLSSWRHEKLLWCTKMRSSSSNCCVSCCFLFQLPSLNVFGHFCAKVKFFTKRIIWDQQMVDVSTKVL